MQEEGKEPAKVETKTLPKTKREIQVSRLKRKLLKHVWLVRIAILAGIIVVLWGMLLIIGNILGGFGVGTYFTLAKNFIFTPQANIQSIRGRTNILILGKGGGEHEAPDLADTIIFTSISHNGGATMVSLPRDIWVPELRAKLNSTYYWGNQRQEGGGLVLAKSAVEEIVGEPVHYGMVIDFSAFKHAVDVVGGIEVEVENSFTDEMYPIPGKENDECKGDPEFRCRYETIRFEEGLQTMDGESALKFVRSRNAEGDEGTDIARAKRQQKVISAIQGKLFSPSVIFSPSKLRELFAIAKESIETDMESPAGAIIARRAVQSRGDISSYVLDGEFLENPPTSPRYDSLYIFIPIVGSWDEVHEWIEEVLP